MTFRSFGSAARSVSAALLFALTLSTHVMQAQGTLEDYTRAQGITAKGRGLVLNVAGLPNWIGETDHFWYTKSVKDGTEFYLVDATAGSRKSAFDQEKLAAAINAASGGSYKALTLPFAPALGGRGAAAGRGRGAVGAAPTTSPLNFIDNEQSIEFGMGGAMYTCKLAHYTCTKGGAIPVPAMGAGRGRGGAPRVEEPNPEDPDAALMATEMPQQLVEGGIAQPFPSPQQDFGVFGRGAGQPRCGTRASQAAGQGRGGRNGGRGAATATPARGAAAAATETPSCPSFDGKWDAIIENYNVFLRPQAGGTATPLSYDGSEGNAYSLASVAWSPDSKHLVAYHTRPGYPRLITYIESSPADQVQPKTYNNQTLPNSAFGSYYRKPGDAVDIAYPALFEVDTRKEIEIDHALFPNAFDITQPVWWKDGRGFTFEYNQRGHQVYRVIEADVTGKTRPLIDEHSDTFIYYSNLGPGLSAGRKYRHDVNDGKEIIWASERDGWEHLYLYDGVTGKVKNQITKGDWLVRNVDRVDDEKRQIYFYGGGMIAGQDPYFVQYCRINFDGTGLTKFTEANGDHAVTFSLDHKYYVDSWSRVDLPAQSQLRRAEDQKVVMDLEKGDASALLAAGIKFPEVFTAKGRDGKTDIWGVIIKPTNFDPSKKYPVIENIYAGPQGSFVPKTFAAVTGDQSLAELGFIVVHIDGMGTSNRSKAFHDKSFQDLGDAGFPDRILWHKAVAAKYPWYDISRVGIFGTSAGGQNSLGGVLFHPEFYKVVVTNSGCHDNRMDKIWWNEQWMGWPLGPKYAESSNVDNAYRLQGKALIIVGERDTNVDPASSLQVVNALVKAHKHFDMLYIPGQDHGVGILGTEHFRDDYFVHNLLGVEPPDWNKVSLPPLPADPAGGN